MKDVKALFYRLTIDSATEFLFGESIDSQLSNIPGYMPPNHRPIADEKDFASAFDRVQSQVSDSILLGDLYWLVQTKEFKENCKRCHAFIDLYVHRALSKEKTREATTTSAGKQKFVFLDALAESNRDPVELRDQLLNVLLAGRDTTASLFSFHFMTLSRRPDIFAKLRATVLEHFGTFTNPRNMTFEALKNCNYLQWAINETLRLYPSVPFNQRHALKDTCIPVGGGPDGTKPVYVKKGVNVDYSVYMIHRRKDLWGEDADEFRPERWDGRRTGWEYLPFNGGPRICIGQ